MPYTPVELVETQPQSLLFGPFRDNLFIVVK